MVRRVTPSITSLPQIAGRHVMVDLSRSWVPTTPTRILLRSTWTSRKHWAGCRKAHNLRIPVGQFSRTRAYYTRSTCWAVSPRAHSRRPKPKLVSTNRRPRRPVRPRLRATSSKRMPSRPKRPVWPPKPKSRRSAQRPSPRRRPQPKLPPRRPSRPLPQRAQKHPLKAKPKLPPQNKRRTLLSGIPVNFPTREFTGFFHYFCKLFPAGRYAPQCHATHGKSPCRTAGRARIARSTRYGG